MPSVKSRQHQGSERQQKTFLAFAVYTHVYCVPCTDQPQNFANVVPATLHIDVFVTGDLAVLVQVHDLAVPSP